jgi:hypothetical protein
MKVWSELAKLSPEEIENLFEHVYTKYAQPFKPVSVDAAKREVVVELKDNKQVTVNF